MAGIKEEFSVFDEFEESLNRFNKAYDLATKGFEKSEKAAESVSNKEDELARSSDRASDSIGGNGLGGAFLMLNQAMQFFERIAGKVMENLEDIGDKQRSFILLGKEAGAEFNIFAQQAASSMGRAENEIRKAGQRWHKLGIGGDNIKELTTLADRFANLNPDREFSDIADSFADAIKSRSSSSLADLLGGGEFVEQKLERKHIDRYLKQGDISGALDQFKTLADELGYTQDKADELGNTFDKKVLKIVNKVRNYFTDLISDIVSIFEPYVDKFIDWLNDDSTQEFFANVKDEIIMAASAAAALVDTIVDGWKNMKDAASPAFDKIKEIATDVFPFLKEESLGVVDTLIGIFVGGVGQIVFGVWELVQKGWNLVLTIAEKSINGLLWLGESLANGIIKIVNSIRSGIIGVITHIVEFIGGVVNKLAGTSIGEMLGLDKTAKSIENVTNSLKNAQANGFDEIKLKRVDFSEYKVQPIDSVKMTSDLIGSAINKTHSFFNKSINAQNKANDKMEDALGGIKDDTGKLVGMGQKEQDLRWMKEMAEQHFINEINLRQLTPSIQLKVEGTSNQTPNQYAKALAAELQRMADAGTFNAYGNVG